MAVTKLREGGRIVGTMVRMVRNPAVAQIAASAGLDFIMCDMEHGSYSLESFADIAKVARSVGLGIFVRVPELAKSYVSRALDAGAQGVMVPMVDTEEQARQLVGWARYAPIGRRGLGTSGGHTAFGPADGDAATFMARQNRETLAIAQIESREAVANIDRIAAVEGLDVLLVGPNDLSISLGVAGETGSDAVREAIGRVKAAALGHGKVFAMHAGDSLLEEWAGTEMRMVMNNLDISLLRAGFASIARTYGRK